MRVATAFSGGLASCEFALKYENIPHEVVFACEFDKYARQQYLEFHGEPKTFYNYISDLDANKYKDSIDLFVFGSPCQDLSLAGKRKGFDGKKSSLFREGTRVMSEMMPKAFIFENVKGLLSSNNGNDYKEVIKTFQYLGYHITMQVLNTKDYGVPQNRERVFIVGFLDHDKHYSFEFENTIPLTKRLRDVLEDDVDEKYYLSEKLIKGFMNKKGSFSSNMFKPLDKDASHTGCLTSRYHKCATTDPYIKEPQLNQIGNIDQKGHNSLWGRVYDTNGLGTCLNANGGGAGAKTGLYQVKSATKKGYETATENDSINFTFPESKTRRGRVGKGVAQTLDTACNQGVIECFGGTQANAARMINISPCLTSAMGLGGGHRPIIKSPTNEFRIRRLTPKECFRLMGVKDKDISLVTSDTQAYKISGNAISVNVMQSIIRSIYKNQSQNLFNMESA